MTLIMQFSLFIVISSVLGPNKSSAPCLPLLSTHDYFRVKEQVQYL